MGKLWELIKVIIGMIIIMFLIYFLLSNVFNRLPPEQVKWYLIFVFFSFLLLGMVIFFMYAPLRKAVKPDKSLFEYNNEIAKEFINGGTRLPVVVGDNYANFQQVDADIQIEIADKYIYTRFEDNDPNKGIIKKNILYDKIKGRVIGRINAESMNVRPKEAIKEMIDIIEQLEAGKVPRVGTNVAPVEVREIIDRTVAEQKKEEKEGLL